MSLSISKLVRILEVRVSHAPAHCEDLLFSLNVSLAELFTLFAFLSLTPGRRFLKCRDLVVALLKQSHIVFDLLLHVIVLPLQLVNL